jgi:hypothetical protein
MLASQTQMKPSNKWINDWYIGVKSSRENAIAADLLNLFMDFWDKLKLDEKSKTTRNRYSASLHALGGYLVEQAISDDDLDKTAGDLLSEYIGPDVGPLIFQDNESWQDEVDMVCRKIYKHMKKKC